MKVVAMARYKLRLSKEEREELLQLIKIGKGPANTLMHARILLAIDENNEPKLTELEISQHLYVSTKSIQRIRKKAVEDGLEVALNRKSYTSTRRISKVTGEVEAHLIAISCGTPPKGRSHWTMKLLANQLVQLEIIDEISAATVQRTLKKIKSNRG